MWIWCVSARDILGLISIESEFFFYFDVYSNLLRQTSCWTWRWLCYHHLLLNRTKPAENNEEAKKPVTAVDDVLRTEQILQQNTRRLTCSFNMLSNNPLLCWVVQCTATHDIITLHIWIHASRLYCMDDMANEHTHSRSGTDTHWSAAKLCNAYNLVGGRRTKAKACFTSTHDCGNNITIRKKTLEKVKDRVASHWAGVGRTAVRNNRMTYST